MDRLQFCTSLRQRPACSNAVMAFRTAKWREARLETHDAAMLLPAQQSRQLHESVLRASFVSTSDLDVDDGTTAGSTFSAGTWQRIERLYYLNGSGQDSVIVFVLEYASKDNAASSSRAMNLYTKLQAEYVMGPNLAFYIMLRSSHLTMPMSVLSLMESDLVIPVVPCATWELVPQTLVAFHRQLCVNRRPKLVPRAQNNNASIEQTLEVLRHSITHKPLSDHSIHVLTDLTTGFRDYLDKLDDPEAQEKILGYLGEEGQRALAFWLEDFLVPRSSTLRV
ncbi:uncharacterized protein B0I36DRAFT_382094 [Microdochium trichocladiopsis]|uniref:Uncharacterized protein n=1 Tax=Microdochium trichocladiopsis TaxID=1682393 RepID=A0A9P8YEA5_9PEZI|nr:uncharacterized protein B0I36DRAFT_382094 [Microdochium trichocladiopsis]KAH7035367.1 hypothetical protein B0I36DRAFT_382094 [Microdochium trichocladiopsis]